MVSVVIPTRNRASLLSRAIDSILNQTYRDWECIIVDGQSSDNTYQVVHSFKDERIIYLLNKSGNCSASANRNAGIKIARGNYIAFLDDDDEWMPEKLEKQVKLITLLPKKYGMVYCWMDYYDGDILLHHHNMMNRNSIFPKVLSRIMTGGTPTLLFRKEVVSDIGGFDERILNGDDQDYIRRVAQKYMVDFVPEPLVKVYINHNSESRLSDPGIRKNIQDLILSYELELEKFKKIFNKRPDLKAAIYSLIAYQFALLGDKKNFFNNNIKAWLLWPFRGRIKSSIRGIKLLKQQNNIIPK